MLIGAIPLGVCFFLQWFVPPITNQWLLFAYFSGIALLSDTAFTVVAVPYSTLAAELTTGYDEHTNLVSFKAAFSIGASILSLSLAQVIFANSMSAGVARYPYRVNGWGMPTRIKLSNANPIYSGVACCSTYFLSCSTVTPPQLATKYEPVQKTGFR